LEYYREWEPDACLIEKKAAGAPLIQELRAMGIPISEFSPSRGKANQSNDKLVRLNSVADMFISGRVWAPDTRWAREVVEEVAAFPAGDHDDYVDTCTQALMRVRQGGFIRLPSDEPDEPSYWRSGKRTAYY
jgi:predicted phage terminase large subunit-like protein